MSIALVEKKETSSCEIHACMVIVEENGDTRKTLSWDYMFVTEDHRQS